MPIPRLGEHSASSVDLRVVLLPSRKPIQNQSYKRVESFSSAIEKIVVENSVSPSDRDARIASLLRNRVVDNDIVARIKEVSEDYAAPHPIHVLP